jgi:chromosome segregation ATPase/SAM-dependent methyltransferase
MNLTFRRLGVSELLPRYIFAESLFIRRRVLEVGAVSTTGGASAEFLLQRGARVVLACDDDLQAVADAQARLGSANLRFRAAVFDDLPPGGFDLVLVADLAPWVRAPELLRELVAQVSPTGSLLGGLRNPGGLALAQLMEPDAEGAPPTYGQALDALSSHFHSVEVATQSPLLGYQLAFEKSEGLQVDGSLAGSSEAAYFVVLASQDAHRPVDPTWVQLPPAPLAFTGNRLEEVSTRAREWEERSRRLKESLENARRDSDGLKSELSQTREAKERAEEEARRWQAQTESRERHPLQPLAQDELAARVRRLEAEARAAADRASEAERLLGVKRAELEAVHVDERQGMAQVLAAQESVRLERARREEVTRLLDDARTKLTAAYEELRGVREELSQSRLADTARAPAQGGADRPTVEERLAQARERELRLAEQHSTALAAIESLQGTAATERARAEALEQRVVWLEAERARAERAAESDAARLRAMQEKAQEIPLAGLAESGEQTELAALRDSVERLGARAAVAEAQEKQSRALADRLESELSEAQKGVVPPAVMEELEALRRAGSEAASRAEAAEAQAAAFRERLAEVDTDRQRVEAEASARHEAHERGREEASAQALAEVESLRGELQAARAEATEAASVAARASAAEESLRAEVALARASGAEARASVGAATAAVAEAQAQLSAALAEREALEAARSELLLRAEASEQALREAEAQHAAVQAEAATLATGTLREQLEQAQGQLRVARALRDTLQRDLESERGRARALAESSAAAEARAAEVEAAAAREAEELERVRDAASTAVFERQSLEQQLEASSAREVSLNAELEALRARAESTTSQVAAHTASAEALERQLLDAEGQLSMLVTERAELAGRTEALAEALEAERVGRTLAEEGAASAQQQSEEAGRRADELSELAASAGAQRAALEELRLRLAGFEESAALAQAREAELSARLNEAQSRLEMVQRRATAQETELSALRRASGRPSAEELKSIYERAQAEISAAREGTRRSGFLKEPASNPQPEPPGTKKR